MSQTKAQRQAYQAKWRESHKDHLRAYYEARKKFRTKAVVAEYYYQGRYGISYAEKLAMVARQHGRCALCGDVFKDTKNTHLDHNHTTHKNRDVLCSMCNIGLGKFRESTDILKLAIAYLERHANG